MISIGMVLEQATTQLKPFNSSARMDAEILLCHLLVKNRAYLYAHPEAELDQTQYDQYMQQITERSQNKPIAYLTGEREFWSLSLKVTPDTLIPRHETEKLIELTLELMQHKSQVNLLDLGTGSGAISLALACEKPHWQIDACDLSEEALIVAKENAQQLGITNVTFYHSNWYQSLPKKKYDVIVSNPPYIAENDPHLKQGDVSFEPLSALVSGQDGLADLQYIITHSYEYLLPNGLLLVEHGYDQKFPINAILNQLGYTNISCWQDIQGQDRISGGCRPDII
ncbi:MAG: peptide chain release factor N(5)-glutamine methyltransferase [bacterium]|nr:peptide chain release factor N(5)-glutamine methyltransferase [bacterium]